MSRVVITGANGHLGTAARLLLEKRGYEVIGLRSKELELRDDTAVGYLASFLADKPVVVHLAAWHPPATASTTALDRKRLLDVNVMGTMRVLEACRGGAVSAVVYASS